MDPLLYFVPQKRRSRDNKAWNDFRWRLTTWDLHKFDYVIAFDREIIKSETNRILPHIMDCMQDKSRRKYHSYINKNEIFYKILREF